MVTDSAALADAVVKETSAQLATTVHAERVSAALTGTQSGIVLVDDIDAGIKVVNAYAAEHLEIHTVEPVPVARGCAMPVRFSWGRGRR